MARVLDEVQKAGVGFAHSNGWVWGGFATILLLMLPPVMNWLIDTVGDSPHVSRIAGDHRFPRRGDGGVS
jgi:hypothetical protein